MIMSGGRSFQERKTPPGGSVLLACSAAGALAVDYRAKLLPRDAERAQPSGENKVARIAVTVLNVRHVILCHFCLASELFLSQSSVGSQSAQCTAEADAIRVRR